ncbi:ACP S-malonyltransferase, partial [bacterium]
MSERSLAAAVFPGQGSQKPGMGRLLYEANATFRETFDRISEADGRDLKTLVFESDEPTLRQTEIAQSALYACGVSAYRAWHAAGGIADLFAGHSIGEYAALASAGVLSDADGARLVRRRGELMAEAG